MNGGGSLRHAARGSGVVVKGGRRNKLHWK
jgi:hypothetical protein